MVGIVYCEEWAEVTCNGDLACKASDKTNTESEAGVALTGRRISRNHHIA